MLLYGAARTGVGIHDIFYNAVAGFYLASYGMPNVAIGFLANERSLIGALLQPLVGAASDRLQTPLGRRRPVMLLVIPTILGFLALAMRPDTWLVVLIFILGPLFLGLAVTAYQVLLPDCVVPEQRGLANGVNVFMGFVGGIGLLLVAFRVWESQPGIVFIGVAASLAVGFAITMLTIKEPADGVSEEAEERFSLGDYLQSILQYRSATLYVASYFFFWFGIGGITPFITRFGNEELGVPQNETFLLLLAVMIATMVSAAPAGWLGDRIGKKVMTSWGLIAFAVFILIGSQIETRDQAIVILAFAGIGQAIPSVLAYPLFTELVPARRMGELTGLSTMVWSLAQPIGATVFGAVADATGSLRSVLVGGSIALLISWLILRAVNVPRKVPPENTAPVADGA
ncbi:MAG: MFS/sugar transport protein [Chloroflexi bacterium]|nr:MFS/sugar transport protein [Chloroflexota bacterium]